MSVYTCQMKTHSRTNITDKCGQLNDCIVHGCKPTILHIVAGKRKENFYTAVCSGDEECGKINTGGIDEIVAIWNRWNPINPRLGDFEMGLKKNKTMTDKDYQEVAVAILIGIIIYILLP